jgi:cyclopropane fatty-acyl-phospholipid synthase-like methyltransferase
MDNKENTRIAHDNIAKDYYNSYKDDVTDLEFFDKFLDLMHGKTILDLGCGMGHYSKYMHNHNFTVTGIDFSTSMLEIAKSTNIGIEFINHDICDLSVLNNRKFDGIVIAYVLQHLSKKEVLDLFNSINSHIVDDGYLLLFLRQGDSIVEEIEPLNTAFKYSINEYSKSEISNILESNNYNIIEMIDKDPVDDPNSLAPDTLVVIAQKK